MPKGEDILAGLAGATREIVSRLPVAGEIIAGYDAYKTSQFERDVREFLEHLNVVVERVGEKLKLSWLDTPEGSQYARKVIDCAVDAQLADKKELFAAALVSGAISESTSFLEKLKFVDILRQLSRASLMVLADVHTILGPRTHGPGRNPPPMDSYPLVSSKRLAERFGAKYSPYLVEAAIREMDSHGLFSSTGEWRRSPEGSYDAVGGFATELAYTDFTCRFVEFIMLDAESEQR